MLESWKVKARESPKLGGWTDTLCEGVLTSSQIGNRIMGLFSNEVIFHIEQNIGVYP